MNKFIKKALALGLIVFTVFSMACNKKESCSHSYTSEVTKKATCKNEGEETFTCTSCGDSYTKPIAKINQHVLTRNAICVKCGEGSPIQLNLTESQKATAEKVYSYYSYKVLYYEDDYFYFKFALSSSEVGTAMADATILTVPILVDITILDTLGEIIYSATKKVDISDYSIDSSTKKSMGKAKIEYSEVSHKSASIGVAYFTLFIPEYKSFSAKEYAVTQYSYISDQDGHVKSCRFCSEVTSKQEHEFDTNNICECGAEIDCKKLTFTIANDGKSYIVSGNYGTDVIIPKYYKGLPVSAIASNGFKGLYIKTVKILAEIDQIPYGAFSDCTSLESIEMPNTVKKIGNFAFKNCTNLYLENQMSKNLEEIGYNAFRGCPISALGFTIPKTVKKISSWAFEDTWGFKFIIFEDPTGWTVDGTPIELSNGTPTNFNLLTSTHISKDWIKTN